MSSARHEDNNSSVSFDNESLIVQSSIQLETEINKRLLLSRLAYEVKLAKLQKELDLAKMELLASTLAAESSLNQQQIKIVEEQTKNEESKKIILDLQDKISQLQAELEVKNLSATQKLFLWQNPVDPISATVSSPAKQSSTSPVPWQGY